MNHENSSAQFHRVGSRAVLVELGTGQLDQVMAWHSALSASPFPGQKSVIAAAQTVLVEADSPRSARAIYAALHDFEPPAFSPAESRSVSIDVVYDGPDLAEASDLLGVSTEELIRRHTSQTWLAAFGGFAPGFTYCVPTTGSEEFEWSTPRRSTPRTSLPTGSVGLAGEYSAVYPRTSPGGWQLIGHTDTPMWDATATDSPALLSPGDTVRYKAVREQVTAGQSEATSQKAAQPFDVTTKRRPALRVDSPGLVSLLQDSGRQGYGDIGVNTSGFVDATAAAVANSTVGNDRTAAVIENMGGIEITALIDSVVAVTGAHAPIHKVTRDGVQIPQRLAHPIALFSNERLVVGAATRGARSYVSIRGGFVAPAVLGSISTDVLSGLGAAPLAPGKVVEMGSAIRNAVHPGAANPDHVDEHNAVTLRCVAGPRDDWFSTAEVQRFATMDWTVTDQSNRIGVRMTPQEGQKPLQRTKDAELASEGMVTGSVQVPPSGEPVLFLADHPVTGGYPVIATVIAEDMDKAGQVPPGGTIRFRIVDPDTLEAIDAQENN